MAKSVKRKRLLIDELTDNAEKVLQGKPVSKSSKKIFEKNLKEAVKQHSPYFKNIIKRSHYNYVLTTQSP